MQPMLERTDYGFRLLLPGELAVRIPWSGISRITAFKLDLFTTDLVCVDVEAEGVGLVRLTEDDEGFWTFADAIAGELPNVEIGWIAAVVQGPFAENHTVVFERASR